MNTLQMRDLEQMRLQIQQESALSKNSNLLSQLFAHPLHLARFGIIYPLANRAAAPRSTPKTLLCRMDALAEQKGLNTGEYTGYHATRCIPSNCSTANNVIPGGWDMSPHYFKVGLSLSSSSARGMIASTDTNLQRLVEADPSSSLAIPAVIRGPLKCASPTLIPVAESKQNVPTCPSGRGGEPFPEKLHRLLREVALVGREDVVSFVAEDTFRIHDPYVFFHEVLPQYFRQTKLTSFKRQLKLYGFELLTTGRNIGGYRHKQFSRNDPVLCREMKRVAIKGRVTSTSTDKEAKEKIATVESSDNED